MSNTTNKKITVTEFVKGYKRLTSPELVNKYVISHITTTYAPLLTKKEVLTLMCEKSVVDDDIKYIDMTVNKLNLIMTILALYTDIVVEKDDKGKVLSWQAYDELKSSGALDIILSNIGSDIDELLVIQKEVLDTWHMKNDSTEAYIKQLIEFASRKLGVYAGVGMEKLSEVLSDETKMKKATDLFTKTIKRIK